MKVKSYLLMIQIIFLKYKTSLNKEKLWIYFVKPWINLNEQEKSLFNYI
jgi:hypothetical protein